MIDIFHNYRLQREELLARIAQELQLDKTRLEKMESAYNAVYDLLKKDESFFQDLDIEIYAQGSKRIGTTVKPINDEDFDLDTVMHIYDLFSKYNPTQIYDALVKVIESNDYYKSIYEKKDRCIRLNYKSDFHMDILPACMQDIYDKEKIAIPEKRLQSWSSGNPKGFAEWFLKIAESIQTSMLRSYSGQLLEAKIESEPLPDELYIKTPLQRSVQLIKRYRDLYYQNREYRVSSIVLTTLMARFYNGEESIFDSIDNITTKIKSSYLNAVNSNLRFKVLNPVDENEDFTDSWTNKHYQSFYTFIDDFYNNWQKLKDDFEISGKDYIELFGEGIYKKSLTEQIKTFSNSSTDVFAKANGLILGNNAFTNPQGQINETKGTKNEPHHNFGE
ncbi:nucleotidyltransferase [Flavobacterium sp. SM15]|uniref:nucleotidyltransferase domain-containing protein n=1 Tax=Flavobacterium sp. SM15 TaxID=2908005 RepID=UPI001EDACED2|nr:nucleotidyltransferase [Flavobacterium sp. SM15]MCG2610017.1 nucleotidyltransferase [Flavobacterium sp. SM15]